MRSLACITMVAILVAFAGLVAMASWTACLRVVPEGLGLQAKLL